jgi:hypothetical protein
MYCPGLEPGVVEGSLMALASLKNISNPYSKIN